MQHANHADFAVIGTHIRDIVVDRASRLNARRELYALPDRKEFAARIEGATGDPDVDEP